MEIATRDAEMFMHVGDRGMVERNGLFKSHFVHWVEYSVAWDEDFDASGVDGLRIVQITSAVIEAASTGCLVKIDPVHVEADMGKKVNDVQQID